MLLYLSSVRQLLLTENAKFQKNGERTKSAAQRQFNKTQYYIPLTGGKGGKGAEITCICI